MLSTEKIMLNIRSAVIFIDIFDPELHFLKTAAVSLFFAMSI